MASNSYYFMLSLIFIFSLQSMENNLATIAHHQTNQSQSQRLTFSLPTTERNQPVNRSELNFQLKELFRQQEQIMHSYWLDLKNSLTPTLTPEEHNRAIQDQENQLQLQRFNSFASSLSDGFDATAQLIHTFGKDPRTAMQFKNFGAATLKIASSLNAIMMCSSETMTDSLGNPYIGLALGVSSLIGSLFDNDDSDFAEILHQYFVALSEQLQKQFEITMQRFDFLEQKLDCQSRAMVQGFFSLHKQQNKSLDLLIGLRNDFIEKSSFALQNALYLEESLAYKYNAITSHLNALRTEKINEIVHDALHNGLKSNLPIKKFDKYLNKLYNKATIRGQEPHLNGGTITTTDHESISNALQGNEQAISKSFVHHPAFANLQLFDHLTNRTTTKHLVNPLIWIQCSDAFAQLLHKRITEDEYYPSHSEDKESLITMIKKLHAAGTTINDFLQTLHSNNAIENSIEGYKNTLNLINRQFQQILTTYQQEKLHEIKKKLKEIQDDEVFAITNQQITCRHSKEITEKMHEATKIKVHNPLKKDPIVYQGSYQGSLAVRNFSYKGKNIDTKQLVALLKTDPIEIEKKSVEFIAKKRDQTLKQLTQNTNPNTLLFDLYNQADTPICSLPFSKVIHAEINEYNDNADTYPILLLPQTGLPIPNYYLKNEQNGNGTISHEYWHDDNFFHIKTYYTDTREKKLILHMRHPAEQNHSSFSTSEHLLFYWYGGYFAKKNDVLSWSQKEFTNKQKKIATFTKFFKSYILRDPNISIPVSIPVLPLEPQIGMIDTWPNKAEIVFIDNSQDNGSHIQQKIAFNKKLIEHLNPGAPLHTLIKQLDAQCKIIDSLLVLSYHQEYENCDQLRKSSLLPKLVDAQAVKKYLTEYNDPNSNLATNNLTLSHHIIVVNELINALHGQLENIPYQPLSDLQNTLNRLSATLHMVELKPINSIPNVLPYEVQTLLKEKNQEIELLHNELQQNRNEVKELTEKVNMLIALLNPHNK